MTSFAENPRLSILDLAPIAPGETAAQSFANSVALAQSAEKHGYTRVWYAEHHNMPTIASSATSVLIGHVAGKTSTIRLGAGGIMLPNHSPLVIAEQFGTLATLYPGRIDLGLGRAPGSDQATLRAMRRDNSSAESFPSDVQELQGYLSESIVAGIQATPGAGTRVPLYILGSSMFGAQLAAAFGLPFAFASHFAPAMLHQAAEHYRSNFRPSAELEAPHFIAAVNVSAAASADLAHANFADARRRMVRGIIKRSPDAPNYTDPEIDEFLRTPSGAQLGSMLSIAAVGNPADVATYLRAFATSVEADELIVAHQALRIEDRLASVELTAGALLERSES